jgi:hypothetical protein
VSLSETPVTGTFIDQAQFDALQACMSYIEGLEAAVRDFCNAIDLGSWNYGQTPPPWDAIRVGETQAKSWSLKSGYGVFAHTHKVLTEAAVFYTYLITMLQTNSRAERASPVVVLEKLASPPGPQPMYATAPMSNCLQLLRYHQQWVEVIAAVFTTANPGYAAVRTGIYETLPRVMTFMSTHLNAVTTGKPPPVRLNAARQHDRDVRNHYLSAAGAAANYLVQYSRITTLLNQANQRVAQLESTSTLHRLLTDIRFIQVEMNQALGMCKEFMDLRANN